MRYFYAFILLVTGAASGSAQIPPGCYTNGSGDIVYVTGDTVYYSVSMDDAFSTCVFGLATYSLEEDRLNLNCLSFAPYTASLDSISSERENGFVVKVLDFRGNPPGLPAWVEIVAGDSILARNVTNDRGEVWFGNVLGQKVTQEVTLNVHLLGFRTRFEKIRLRTGTQYVVSALVDYAFILDEKCSYLIEYQEDSVIVIRSGNNPIVLPYYNAKIIKTNDFLEIQNK